MDAATRFRVQQRQYDHGYLRSAAQVGEDNVSYSDLESTKLVLAEEGLVRTGMRVLDVGCGGGLLLRHFQSLGLEATGADISAAAVESLRRHGLDAHVASADNLPFPDASFDLVTACDVVEHLYDQERHVSEVRRVLKPGGVYFVQTPNKPFNLLYLALIRSHGWRAYHPSLLTPSQLQRLLRRHGLSAEFVLPSRTSAYVERILASVVGRRLASLSRVLRPSLLRPTLYHTMFAVARLSR